MGALLNSTYLLAQNTKIEVGKKNGLPTVYNVQGFHYKAITKTINGSWTVPAGGPIRIKIIAKGAKAADANGFEGEQGDIITGEFTVNSGNDQLLSGCIRCDRKRKWSRRDHEGLS